MTNSNNLPTFSFSSTWADLPAHVMNITTHACIFCGDAPIWDSYEAYVTYFYTFEYEGEAGHAPTEQDEWEFLAMTCLG